MSKNNLQRQLAQKITIAVFAGLGIWLALLVQASGAVRNAAIGASQTVGIGPLMLNQLSKQAVDGGSYTISMSFESGLLWYFLAWVVLGAAAGYFLGRKRAS